jgi:hypothetical protein
VLPVCGEKPENPVSLTIEDSMNSDAVLINKGKT